MGMLSFVKEWGTGFSQVTESDRIMTNLTGVNPKGYHPKIYRGGIEAAQSENKRWIAASGAPLTSHEFAVIRLAFLAMVANNGEDFNLAQKCVDAIGRLLRTSADEIRRSVIWTVQDMCERLQVTDSNPTGRKI